MFPIATTASLLFAALVFDTIGDRVGFTDAFIAAILTILVPFIALVLCWYYESNRIAAISGEVEIEAIELPCINPIQGNSNVD